MLTTVMRDSQVGDAWIKEMCEANPVQWVRTDKGEQTANLLSGPVRLSFCDALMEAKPQMRSDPNSKKAFGTTMLFTPFTDFTLFWQEYYRIAAAEFASHYNAEKNQYYGLDNPFYDQGGKAKFQGYTPGLMAMCTTSQFKPSVVDTRNNPVSPEKVYPGVWAIIALNPYASGKQAPRKGPRFGLQAVVIIGDDKPLSGGGIDPRQAFAGVKVKPPVVVPQAAFGQPQLPPQAGNAMAAYPPPTQAGTLQPSPPGSNDEDLSQYQ